MNLKKEYSMLQKIRDVGNFIYYFIKINLN